jgi:hypothetical protein
MREIKPQSTLDEVKQFISLDQVIATCKEMGAMESPEKYLEGLCRYTREKLAQLSQQEGGLMGFVKRVIAAGHAMKKETSTEQRA